MVLTLDVPEDLGCDVPTGPADLEAIETIGSVGETIEPDSETSPAGEETGNEASETTEHPSPPCAVVTVSNTTTIYPQLISDGLAEWKIASDRLEHEIADLVVERVALAERAKSIKKQIDCLAEELSELRASGPQAVWRTAPAAVPPATGDAATPSPGIQASSPPAADEGIYTTANESTWRTAPLAELALKPAVHEKLVEAGIDTIGRLEDLRAEIPHHREKWPKGIGKAKITEIEDAVIAWLTKNRDAAVFQQAAPVYTDPATPNSPATEGTAAGSGDPAADDESRQVPSAEKWEAKTDEQRERWLFDRADWIVTIDTDGQLNPALEDVKFWNSGSDAYKRAESAISDCPYVPGPEMDDWLRGWLYAEREADAWSDTPTNEQDPRPLAATPAAGSSTTFSLDDL